MKIKRNKKKEIENQKDSTLRRKKKINLDLIHVFKVGL
jgi:hypothetical protein